MASFNGVDLGLVFEMAVSAAPKGRQVTAYCGANGLEVLDLGSRGGQTTVMGAVIAATAAALATAEGNLRGLQIDGGTYTLVDTLGSSWSDVILVLYKPTGKIVNIVTPAGYYLGRKYQAEFLHVT